MKRIVGIYIRLPQSEIERLRERPAILPKYDPRVALGDGRGLDIGRAWEELAVFLDGGIKIPDQGPTIGMDPMPNSDDRAAWSSVDPVRVVEMAEQLRTVRRNEFKARYESDEDTADSLQGSRTAGWGDRAGYLFKKLRVLARHYADAAERGEGMLVRIGERV